MKLLYLRSQFWFNKKAGGSVAHTAGVINTLTKKHDLTIFSNDKLLEVNNDVEIVDPRGLKTIPLRLGEIFYSVILIRKLKPIISTCGLIYQRYSGLSFAGAHLSERYKVPLMLEYNSSDVWKIKNWQPNYSKIGQILLRIANMIRLPIIEYIEQYNLQKADYITVVSEPLRRELLDFGVDKNRILLVPNGVDHCKYSPEVSGLSIREKFGITSKIVVGFIGTFGQWHGVVELANAIAFFFKRYPQKKKHVMFMLIGDGRLMKDVMKIIKENEIDKNVILPGLVPQRDGPYYLAACDILVSPHKKNPDGSQFFGSPTKLFEYMAMGKAIVASDLDQIGEVLENDRTALLVEPENITELAEKIAILVERDELRNRLGESARKEVVKSHTWEKKLAPILEKLQELSAEE